MFKKILTASLCALIFCCFSADLFAKNKYERAPLEKKSPKEVPVVEPLSSSCSSGDIHAVPPALDPAYRHKKKGQVEFYAFGGSYLGNTLDQTWTAGGKLFYHLNNTFAIGPSFSYARLLTDKSTRFGRAMETPNAYIADMELMVSNDAAFRSGNSLIKFDFYFTLGVGALSLNNAWEPTGMVGGGVKFYPGISWFALRIDVNNYLHVTEQPGRDNFDADVAFIGGISILLPPKPSAYEKK